MQEEKGKNTPGIKLKHIINFHKVMTAIVIVSLMSHYKNYHLGSFLYLALHSIYGAVWVLKGTAFPDQSFNRKVGLVRAAINLGILSGYWILPWLQISGHGIDKPSSERVLFTVLLFTCGVALMMSSDAQKNFTLKHRPGLITDGMFKYTRNPNFLGEMMIHCSFAFATGSYIAWGIIATIWVVYFLPRMIAKDCSLRCKGGADEYFKQSSFLLPKLFFRNTLLNYLTWMAIFVAVISIGETVSWTHFFKKIHPFKYLSNKF